jgi:hypothetical protein
VTAGHGARLPTAPFNLSIWPTGLAATPANAEIVRVTAVVGDVLTIVRTQESTTARSVTAGDQVAASITTKLINELASPVDLILTGSLSIGTNPATTGTIRLANNSSIKGRNFANTGDVQLILLDINNDIQIGTTTSGMYNRASVYSVQASNYMLFSGPTRVFYWDDSSLRPNATTDLTDLGSTAQRWRNLYLSGSVAVKVKAGTPTDADTFNPVDGMMILDSTANKIWVRLGGLWKGVVVA